MKQFYSFIIAALSLATTQNAMAQWKPTSCKYYEKDYNTQKWKHCNYYQYTYDIAGNMIMGKGYVYDADLGEAQVTGPIFDAQVEYTYDATNRLTGYVAKHIDDYNQLKESGSCTIGYDDTDPDIITSFERTGEILTDEDYAPQAYYRKLTRDANGNITQIVISGYFNGELTDVERVTMTYEGNKPVTIKEESKLSDPEDDEGEAQINSKWQTLMELTDIQWESTGKHLYMVITDPFGQYENMTKYISKPYQTIIENADETNWLWFTKIVEGDYRIKSAKYKQHLYGFTITASLSATYDSDGGYELTLNTSSYGMKDIFKKEYTDTYGSFVYTENTYEDDELTDMYKLVVTKDEHGNTTEDIAYDNDGEGDPLEVASSNIFSYAYYEDTDEFASITCGNDKYVYGDFIDVTKQTGIRKIKTDTNAPTSIFDISGCKIGSSLDNLKSRKGLIIVKQDGKVRKMFVK